jgi:bifunctional UDP-N-acetylglucosamine pyrophosphorylase/glucosamine-1-phosphate N-acetyltransferase
MRPCQNHAGADGNFHRGRRDPDESIVAPIKIGAGAYIGSGSVITNDVAPDAPDALALGRGRQVEKAGWAKDFRARHKGVKTGQK